MIRRILASLRSIKDDAQYMNALKFEFDRIERKAIRDAEHSAEFHEENVTCS
ncbi:MAG: hypothetical protein V7786_01800 [Sulfitobacter litoralis]|uniref:hypothetical protein n=1 Tax=Sulfitobacter litoralis TaxID=335975 RepID=UPI0030017584